MDIVFGPVNSRRLGRSLGVSIVPHKVCSFDCLYCEVGKTGKTTLQMTEYVSAAKVLAEFHSYYPKVMDSVDVVTVTGAGEPTLNTALLEIVEGLQEISKHPLALLTNASTFSLESVKTAAKRFDIVMPNLDAAVESVFRTVNRPHPSVSLERIISGIKSFAAEYTGKLYIELLLVKGVNDGKENLLAFAKAVRDIKYLEVQLSTVFRPPAYEGAILLTEKEMEDVYLFLLKQGVRVHPVGVFALTRQNKRLAMSLSEAVLAILSLRPMTEKDLALGLSIEQESVDKALKNLMEAGKIKSMLYAGEKFYCSEIGAVP